MGSSYMEIFYEVNTKEEMLKIVSAMEVLGVTEIMVTSYGEATWCSEEDSFPKTSIEAISFKIRGEICQVR